MAAGLVIFIYVGGAFLHRGIRNPPVFIPPFVYEAVPPFVHKRSTNAREGLLKFILIIIIVIQVGRGRNELPKFILHVTNVSMKRNFWFST